MPLPSSSRFSVSLLSFIKLLLPAGSCSAAAVYRGYGVPLVRSSCAPSPSSRCYTSSRRIGLLVSRSLLSFVTSFPPPSSLSSLLISYSSTLRNIDLPSASIARPFYFPFALCQFASRDVSRLSTSCQRSRSHHDGEISGFRRWSRPSFFLSHVTPSSRTARRGAARRDSSGLALLRRRCFRCASSSIVDVFLLLHPSMPTALPSINISFHLSGSSAST